MQIRNIRTLLMTLLLLFISALSFAQVRVSVTFGPPALPVYEQPLCPGEGYIWTPGFWAYGDDFNDYYWVPGTWVLAPEVGFLWTPAYWAWEDGAFVFYEGYWGPQVGFYGGINYGFGYFGEGYEGGRWDRERFFYNRSVTNINITNIHNVYEAPVTNRTTVTRVSYNGGDGGINARPTPQQEAAARERHIARVAAQTQHIREARSNPQQRASMNEGKPPVAATPRPGKLKGSDVIHAKEAGAPYARPANHGNRPQANPEASRAKESQPGNNAARPNAPVHPRELSPAEKPPGQNTGDPKRDKKYQQQQEKQFAKQEQERNKLEQKQEQEHQRLERQHADEARKQQVEQRHQQQTQQLQQKQEQQRQKSQQRDQHPNPNRSEPPK